jgi:amino-acid N-acetyltransferase
MIRAAREDDVPHICALLAHPAMRGAVLPRSDQAIASGLDDWTVGTNEQCDVVGCVALEARRSDLAEIRSLSVSPEARGQGFASALLRTAVAQAWQRGFPSVFAQTRALSLFERAGFRHMACDAEHRPLCGRMLRSGYHRVRIDALPLSLSAPELTVGPTTLAPDVDGMERDAAVGRLDVTPEGALEPIASDPDGIAPPGFHFHRYRSVASARPHVVI